MSNVISYLESMKFYGNRDLVYRLRGWCVGEDGGVAELRLEDENGKEISCEVERQDRTDVLHKEKNLKADRPEIGFCVTVRDPEKTLLQVKKMYLKASYKGRSEVIASSSGRRLRKAYKESRLVVNIDTAKKLTGEIRIMGWVLCYRAVCCIRVIGPDGRSMHADVRWSRRIDLERLGLADKGTEPAFTLSIPVDPEKEKEIRSLKLVFSGVGQKEEVTVPLVKKKKKALSSDRREKLLQPSYWKRAVKYLQRNGLKSTFHHTFHRDEEMGVDYGVWFEKHRVQPEELKRQREEQQTMSVRPLISICIPFYNTRLPFLEALLRSIISQSYTNWELCLADGSTNDDVEQYVRENYGDYLGRQEEGRFIYRRLEKNYGIAGNTNAAIAMASGDYIMLSDHDDFLEPDALFAIVKAINEDPSVDILYTDEDLTDETGLEFNSPRFKPDYNPDFLCSINYICHIFMVRATIMKEVGGFREEFDGAQDWDMILRCTEKTDRIHHIPKILYHWRAYEDSTAGNPDSKRYAIDAGKRAVEEHYQRIGQKARIDETNVFILFQPYLYVEGQPKVSIVICNKDQAETLETCVRSILDKSTYGNYEIVIVENNSTEQKTFDMYEKLQKDSRVRVVTYKADGPFNYSAVNNFGAEQADGEYLILLNNDTKVITEDWIERMLGFCQRENTGIVGAKLYYPDQTVQHCGVVVGIGGFAGHVQTMAMRGDAGYFGRLLAVQDISAVTGACLMIRRNVWDEVGGLDTDFRVALNDVDLCLRVRKAGKLVVLNPSAELFHYESKSRGSDEDLEKQKRFHSEIRLFRERWKDILDKGDPYYNPNLTLMYGDCRLRGDQEYFQVVEDLKAEEKQ